MSWSRSTPVLCPTVLPEIKGTYWRHVVNEDFMLNYFLDLDFLLRLPQSAVAAAGADRPAAFQLCGL